MKKVCVVIPWFGKLRNDFGFWMKSVEYNSTIDFLFPTDQEVAMPPRNLKVVKTTLQEVENLAKERIDKSCVIKRAYKLCDYKPTYGILFSDYLKDYDFWGNCDADLVFGDIRHFITDEILSSYDKILELGHLTLYRNVEWVNNSFYDVKEPNWKTVLHDDKGYSFDEWGGVIRLWSDSYAEKVYRKPDFDDITPHVYKFLPCQEKREKNNQQRNIMYSYDRGKLVRLYEEDGEVKTVERLYVHIQKRHIYVKTSVSDRFMIIPNCFIKYRENVDLRFLRRNVRESIFWTYVHRAINKLAKYCHLSNTEFVRRHNLVLCE